MAEYVVLVNGLPGAGKTTLAARLAPALGVPLIGKDAIKEALAGAVPSVPPWALGLVAVQAMWEFAAAIPGGVVIESWWFRPRDRGLAEAGLRRSGARAAVEIWCAVPAEVALSRYEERHRGELYEDEQHQRESWPEWAAEGRPLEIAEVVPVRTDREVDVFELVGWVDAALGQQLAPGRPPMPEQPEETQDTRPIGAVRRPPSPLPNPGLATGD